MYELIAIAAVAVVGWFAAGTIYNVRKASALMRWMQDGLPALGERTTVRWLGSTAVQMSLREARGAFSGATLVIFLEPRDLPWWPLSRASGRRDTLIVRGILRAAPSVELEALDPSSWSGRDALPRVPREWPLGEAAPGGLAIRAADAAALERARELVAAARGARLDVKRLSVRRAEPHFQVHAALPEASGPSGPLFEALQSLAERASAPHA